MSTKKASKASAKTPKESKDPDDAQRKKPARAAGRAAEPALEAVPPGVPAPAPRKGRGKAPVDLGIALVEAFATNERINQYLLEELDSTAWAAEAPIGKGRTIRAIVAHLHNVRHMWLVVSAEGLAVPDKVNRATLTLEEARGALAASAAAMDELLRRCVAAGGHVKDFKPDVAGFVAYLIAHEAHHRGQICMLARLLGKPLDQKVGFGMWEWRKRHAETQPDE